MSAPRKIGMLVCVWIFVAAWWLACENDPHQIPTTLALAAFLHLALFIAGAVEQAGAR